MTEEEEDPQWEIEEEAGDREACQICGEAGCDAPDESEIAWEQQK